MNNEKLQAIAQASLKFIYDNSERDWSVYPMSFLPYPKEDARRAIRGYFEEIKDGLSSIDRLMLQYEYVSLADFVNDDDAAIVNSVDSRFEPNVKDSESMRTIPLPKSLKNSSHLQRYMDVTLDILHEKTVLAEEIGLHTDPSQTAAS